jgi:hypothetical protein
MFRAWVVITALGGLAACGRVAFDPVADGAAAPCTGDFVVDTTDDDPGATLACDGLGCSLRGAVARANAGAGSTICVRDDLPISLATAVAVSGDVTIVGPASVCGAGADRVFRVLAGGKLRLRDLTVCHGRLVDVAGAGVLVETGALLDTNHVVFDDNAVSAMSTEENGGAIHADGDAIVEIRNSRFTNNRVTQGVVAPAYARGAAFAIQAGTGARVVIEDTSFENNMATNVGGALYLAIDATKIKLDRLLFVRNASNTGGAIDINCASTGTFVIESSTFVDNAAAGATIFVCRTQTVRLSFCSFSGGDSELVQLADPSGRAEWHASAVHSAFDLCSGPGAGTSLDFNIADRDGTVCPLTRANDRLADPMFASLADNGGSTLTMALGAGSPAIDAGGAVCPAVDQRGAPRPARTACDVGAFEAQ